MTADLVPDWLARRARTHAGIPALRCGDLTWTFADLDARAAAGAAALAALSPDPEAPIALLAGNSPAFVATVHAAVRAGRTLMPLNTRLTAPELTWQLGNAGAGLLLHDERHADLALAAASGAGGMPLATLGVDGPVAERAGPQLAGSALSLDLVQSIIHTSGTTGRPKGAMLTLGCWWWGAAGSALHLGHRQDDCWLAAMPLFHVGGLSILFRSVIGGVPVILHESFDPERTNRALDREGVTLVSVVASMLGAMVEGRNATYPGNLRAALLGGGPAPDALMERARALGIPVAPTYGLTEAASQVTTLLPGEFADRPGSAGSPLPQAEVRIERDGAPLPPGSDGEIAIRTRTLMRGYLGHAPLPSGAWFRTGDMGRLDEDGYLTVLDRRDDLIVSGGENIYPAEIESALFSHPDVLEAAVVGLPDARWGSVPVAFVAVCDGATASDADLLAHVAGMLAGYKRPKRIVRVERLPRTAAGKVLRRELRAVAEA